MAIRQKWVRKILARRIGTLNLHTQTGCSTINVPICLFHMHCSSLHCSKSRCSSRLAQKYDTQIRCSHNSCSDLCCSKLYCSKASLFHTEYSTTAVLDSLFCFSCSKSTVPKTLFFVHCSTRIVPIRCSSLSVLCSKRTVLVHCLLCYILYI